MYRIPCRAIHPCICFTSLPHFFFFNDTPTTEIYTLSLHDALPIFGDRLTPHQRRAAAAAERANEKLYIAEDRKSTRLNSSHRTISYAVFCLKKKNISPNNKYS